MITRNLATIVENFDVLEFAWQNVSTIFHFQQKHNERVNFTYNLKIGN